MGSARSSNLYRIVGFAWSNLKPIEYTLRSVDASWVEAVREVTRTDKDFQFVAVLVDRRPVQAVDAGIQTESHRERLVIGFDLASRRTTLHHVISTDSESAVQTVGKRYPHHFQHVTCGCFDGDVEALLTNIGFLDLNQPVVRLISESETASHRSYGEYDVAGTASA